MLTIATEAADAGAESALEVVGRCAIIASLPHGLDQLSKGLCESTLHAKRVGSVVFTRLIAHQEVFGELGDVGEALEAGVHEASVAEVVKTTKTLVLARVEQAGEALSLEISHVEGSNVCDLHGRRLRLSLLFVFIIIPVAFAIASTIAATIAATFV